MLLYCIAVLVSLYFYQHFIRKRQGLPPGPTPWPFFGNLFQIDLIYPEKTIGEWSKRYGKVLTIWLPDAVICLNDFELIKKHFIKNGDAFAGRPPSFIVGEATGNFKGVVFSWGRRWKEQRRFAINALRNFGFGRNIMEQKIMLEGHWLVEALTATQQRPFDPWEPIEVAVANIIGNILIGRRYEPTEARYQRVKKASDEVVRAFESPLSRLVDMWPWLHHLPYFRAAYLNVVATRGEVNKVMAEFIEEHKQAINQGQAKESEDFVSTYLDEMQRRKKAGEDMGYFEEKQLVMTAADLMIAGMETTVTTLRWGIAYLINYPDIQRKAHAELDAILGAEADVTMADRARLPYNSAVVQEMTRVSNILPINLLHTLTEDTQVEGFRLTAGTKCLPQIGNVMTDPAVFPNPHLFDPTRYLYADGSAKKVEELVPFSVGKRQCLGESLARAELFMLYVTMMQRFRFVAPPTGTPTLIPIASFVRKLAPFECVALKRH